MGQERDPEVALTRFMTAHAQYFEAHYDDFATMLVGYGGMKNITMIEDTGGQKTTAPCDWENFRGNAFLDASKRPVESGHRHSPLSASI